MPKDPIRNADRYKVRGGQINAFEFHQHQGAISQHEHENWAGGQADEADLPPDQAKAERIRRLLAAHGESVPESAATSQTEEAPEPTEDETMENETALETSATTPTEAASDSDESDRFDESDTSSAEAPPEPDYETISEEFAPTHGRPPEVIEEMLQARRATDVVPEPEDVAEGRTGEDARREEAGQPEGAPATPARPRPRPRKAKAAKATAAAKPKGAKAKAAPARKTAKKAAAKKAGKPAAAAKKGAKPAARKGAKKVTAQKGGKKAAARKSTKKAPARKTASSKAKARVITKTTRAKATKKQAKKAGRKRR